MKKLVQGILEFRKTKRKQFQDLFSKLALGQTPDSLFVACSDSRVVPNLFASTEPGDLFVIRNVGNLVAPCGQHGKSSADESEAAAVEFAVENLNVSDIIICGHSECGAMQALYAGREKLAFPNLKNWLRHGDEALDWFKNGSSDLNPSPDLAPHNRLSQLNVIAQMRHIRTYPSVSKKIAEGKLRVHGWWFELKNLEVWSYEPLQKSFVVMDETEVESILRRLAP